MFAPEHHSRTDTPAGGEPGKAVCRDATSRLSRAVPHLDDQGPRPLIISFYFGDRAVACPESSQRPGGTDAERGGAAAAAEGGSDQRLCPLHCRIIMRFPGAATHGWQLRHALPANLPHPLAARPCCNSWLAGKRGHICA